MKLKIKTIKTEELKNKVRVLGAALTALAATACGGHSAKQQMQSEPVADMHTAEIALDYEGTYKGVLPAADCPGLEMTLTLHPEGTYDLHHHYLERDADFNASGEYALEGDLLTLEGGSPSYFRVEENRLRYLDAEKKPIEGSLAEQYLLYKTTE